MSDDRMIGYGQPVLDAGGHASPIDVEELAGA